MNGLRKFLVGLLAAWLVFTLLATAWSHIFLNTVYKRETVMKWLEEGGVYTSAADLALEASQEKAGDGSNFQLDDPKLQAVARQTFSAEYLQTNAEKVINGIYDWFEGKTPTLSFNIDVGDLKTRLADGVAQFATERMASLPACVSAPAEFNPLDADCLPSNVSPEQAVQIAKDQIVKNPDFLPDSTLTASDLKIKDKNGLETPIDQAEGLKKARDIYQNAKWIPWLLALLSAILAAGVVFISSSRRKGLRRVGWSSIIAGGILAFSFLIATSGVSWSQKRLLTDAQFGSDNARALASNLAGVIAGDFKTLLALYSGLLLLIGVGLVVFCHYFRRSGSTPKKAPETQTAEKSVTAEKEAPKPEKAPPDTSVKK